MNFFAKLFDELELRELYEILRVRSEIFLLEQNIVCQDMDRVDYLCLHCFLKEKEKITACLRAFLSENEKDTVHIGRVLTLCHGKGDGRVLMEKSLKEIEKNFSYKKIVLHAQIYAKGFYEKFGFVAEGEEFMEEGVPHILMVRKRNVT